MTRDYASYWSDLSASHAAHPGNRFRYGVILREIERLAAAPRSIIDCGCGDGALLQSVTARIRYEDVWGVDVANNVPANRPGGAIRFQQHDLGRPAPESLRDRFALVLCSEVIEHVDDDEAVLQNLAALVAPGGAVILTTQSGNIYKTEQYLGHLRHYQLAALSRRIERCGLTIRSAYRCGWPWLNLQKLAAHLFQDFVQQEIVQAPELSGKLKLAFGALSKLYRLNLRGAGPQIVIVAVRPSGSLPGAHVST